MKVIFLTGTLLALCMPGLSHANAKLAEAKQCMQCHALDKQGIGPSFQAISAVYKRMKSPETRLIEVMRKGSDANLGPHWGSARMPDDSERPRLDDKEARQLAKWILSGPRM